MAATDTAFSIRIGRRFNLTESANPPRRFSGRLRKAALFIWVLPGFSAVSVRATDLKPDTVAAFNRYIAASEAQRDDDDHHHQFLFVDRLPDEERQKAYEQLQQGEPYIEELHAEDAHHPIAIPNGLVHDWAGVIFIPKGTLAGVVAVLQDYDRQAEIYQPDVRRAKLLEQQGNQSKIFEQFYSKTIVTVVLNAYFDVQVKPMGNSRVESISRSTRIVEVDDFGSPGEHERTDGKDRGFMWRLDSYWRVEQKDGGVYVENESISLSRPVPVLFAWIVNPLTKSIPRDVLAHTLTNTRKAVLMAAEGPKPAPPQQGIR